MKLMCGLKWLTNRYGRGITISVLVVLLAVICGGATYAALLINGGNENSINLERGLIGHWKLDNSPEDSTLNGYDGTVANNVVAAPDRTGRSDAAYSFDATDGTGDYISMGGNNIFNVNPGQVRTFSIWLKTGTDIADNKFFFWKNGACIGWDAFITSSGQIRFTQVNGDQGCSGSRLYYTMIASDKNYIDNQWHLMTAVIDRSAQTGSLYVDGSLKDTITIDDNYSGNGGTLLVGSNWNNSAAFTGSLDDARIYDRAISAEEAAALYAQYNPVLKAGADEKGLIGRWRFDGNGKDSTPYGLNATLTGAATYGADRKGRANSALSLSGAGDYAQMLNVPSDMRFTDSSNFTLSAWIKPSAVSGIQTIIGQQRSSHVHFRTNGNSINLCLDDACASSTSGTGSITANVWQHVVATYDGSTKSATLYIDGQATSAPIVTYDGNGMPAYANWYIGYESRYGDQFLGSIDDARIYNRVLSAAEISTQYASYDSQLNLHRSSSVFGGAAVNLSSGLIGHWPMNGNAKDSTPYSNNGIVNGALLATDRRNRTNSAYSFNGTSDYIQMNGPVVSSNATIAGWYKYPDSSNITALFRDATCSGGWLMWGNGTQFSFRVGGSQYNTGVLTAPYTNQWVHLAIAKEGPSVIFYVNGVNEFSGSGAADTASIAPWRIMKNGLCANWAGGSVDDFRIYNRALSEIEMQVLYQE